MRVLAGLPTTCASGSLRRSGHTGERSCGGGRRTNYERSLLHKHAVLQRIRCATRSPAALAALAVMATIVLPLKRWLLACCARFTRKSPARQWTQTKGALLCICMASTLARGWSTGGLQMPKGRCSLSVASRKRLGTKMSPAMCSAGLASPHRCGHSIGMHRFKPGRDGHSDLWPSSTQARALAPTAPAAAQDELRGGASRGRPLSHASAYWSASDRTKRERTIPCSCGSRATSAAQCSARELMHVSCVAPRRAPIPKGGYVRESQMIDVGPYEWSSDQLRQVFAYSWYD